jgi:hypothetical protein
MVDVFVDDFIAAAQGSVSRLLRVRRILFHAIDQIFHPLDDTDTPFRKEPASVKKLKQGDADWGTCGAPAKQSWAGLLILRL